ncbi:MAG: UV DNA damage repair endonuclease UvsE [bacterium]|nr:UV DNA damage repair endonuclease UvsE [bacterium]
MKIGYPCKNTSVGCSSSKRFNLKSYTKAKTKETVRANLECLENVIDYNIKNNIMFFRISSDIVPFASHPVMDFKWQRIFRNEFERIGGIIMKAKMRISTHPDQFVLINALDGNIVERSIKELLYHGEMFDLFGFETNAKIQIHVGGAYKDKEEAKKRFIRNFRLLPKFVRRRLAVENDDRLFTIDDILEICEKTEAKPLLDNFHDALNPSKQSFEILLKRASEYWNEKRDGIIMTDYSSQERGKRRGSHAETIDINDFKHYIDRTKKIDFDIMLEIKDKEKSALKALKYLKEAKRI